MEISLSRFRVVTPFRLWGEFQLQRYGLGTAAGPAQLGAGSAWVGVDLFARGAEDVVGHLRINTGLQTFFEGVFDPAIFA